MGMVQALFEELFVLPVIETPASVPPLKEGSSRGTSSPPTFRPGSRMAHFFILLYVIFETERKKNRRGKLGLPGYAPVKRTNHIF
jgi:hypothetical protein